MKFITLIPHLLQPTISLSFWLITSQPVLANAKNLESLKISHPTINHHWLSRGKLLICQIFGDRL
jgi:hypothetical protein